MKVLETRGLTKIYGDVAAVDSVSLTIEKGDIYGLIGQNGAGKTTFMRMITSLAHPSSGEIELFGQAGEAELQAARKRMGSIIEHPALYPKLTAKQNLEYYRIQRGIPNRDVVQQSLEFVGLTRTGKKKFKDFSMGMKQRLALALTLMSKPDFIILDEPINGLDPIGIVEIRELIKSLSNSGVTILLSSHILTELSQIATKYAFIHEGRLIKNLTHAQLQEECKRALALSVDD
ncbi:MAG: ATP-binding cassette domain-containing protein, partial [Coriobacteriia bacterium]|nr:ATP-binding cassette domain-containing protein [Coriobacteriia bacterium]